MITKHLFDAKSTVTEHIIWHSILNSYLFSVYKYSDILYSKITINTNSTEDV